MSQLADFTELKLTEGTAQSGDVSSMEMHGP